MRLLSRLRRKGGGARLLAERYPRHRIGRGSYGDLNVVEFGEGTTLSVANYCSFARGAQVMLGGNHRIDPLALGAKIKRLGPLGVDKLPQWPGRVHPESLAMPQSTTSIRT